jgi:hypothetical protein
MNDMLTEVWTNKKGDVTCAKYRSIMQWVTIDGIRAEPDQIKVVPPKPQVEKKKSATPPPQGNEENCQWITIGVLHNKMQDLTQVIHALPHRIDQKDTYRLDLEHEVTILCRYVVNKDKIKSES